MIMTTNQITATSTAMTTVVTMAMSCPVLRSTPGTVAAGAQPAPFLRSTGAAQPSSTVTSTSSQPG